MAIKDEDPCEFRRRGKWTARRDARIVDMNADGLSAAVIARDPYVASTESMVIKRLSQLGVPYRGGPGTKVSSEVTKEAYGRLQAAANVRRMNMTRFVGEVLEAASQMVNAILDDDMDRRD